MEYAVPRTAAAGLLSDLKRLTDRGGFALPFPVEVRFTAADEVWMSTAHGRESAYIAVHQYHRMEHERYFDAFEALAREVDGRPHWGKLHGRARDDLRPSYARFDDFVAVRDRVDPDRLFANAYLSRVLGT
jgi:L-gulonolactone oxidase